MTADEQPIFWSEKANTSVLRLIAGGRFKHAGQATLGALLDGEIRTSAETLHVLRRSLDPNLHLVIDADCDLDNPVAALIPISRDGLDRLAALDRLLRQFHGYKVPPDRRLTAQQRRRLKAMLRAADASQHHASQREIAEVIFGVARVAEYPWRISPLRDVVRDLLKDGAAMITGGYRKLLRHRRRN